MSLVQGRRAPIRRILTGSRGWKKFQAWKKLDTYSQNGRLFTVLRDSTVIHKYFKDAAKLVERVNSGHVRFYATPGWRLFPFMRPRVVNCIVAKSYGRFGNQILELACAHALAKATGVQCLTLQETNPFLEGTYQIEDVQVRINQKEIQANSLWNLIPAFIKGMRPAVQIRGAMFLAWNENLGSKSPTPTRELYKKIGQIVDWPESSEKLPDDHVVVHIRSGDVFTQPVNPTYGQPPLSYYQKSISSRNWSKVWVVAEDTRNPIIEKLLEWLRNHSIPHEFHSKGFHADLALLIRAQNIIASRGTLVPSIVATLPRDPHVFWMEQDPLPLEISNLSKAKDSCGRYVKDVLSANWSMADHQVELMLTYPETCLSFEIEGN